MVDFCSSDPARMECVALSICLRVCSKSILLYEKLVDDSGLNLDRTLRDYM